ncbi:methylmalonyl-CoA mutase, partial [Streptomyces sp. SID10244]|nr:methylmalonyl-CoA mutase [Streptomyces sp. SID10244]
VLDALSKGTSGLWLNVGAGISPDDLAAVLDGVYLDLIPVTLDAGADGIASARALLSVCAAAAAAPESIAPTTSTITSLGLSPLTAAFSGRASVDIAEATSLAADLSAGVRTFRVDGTDFATA